MKKNVLKIVLLIVLAIIFARGMMNIFGQGDAKLSGDNVAILSLSGGIFESEKFIKKLKFIEENDNIVGAILKVNSPGGAVTPSNEIYDYLLTMEKPVYVAMGSVAASGGYLVSLAADKIYAMPSTITGSIGVIMNMVNTEELYEKIGLKSVVIKSGRFKDAGNPARPMTEADRKMLDGIVMDMYEQFADLVAKRRNMTKKEVYTVADGRIFTGQQAKNAGLVDNLGSWRDAFIDMKVAFNMPDVKMYEMKDKKEWWEEFLGANAIKNFFSKYDTTSGVYYMLENW